MSGGNGDRYGVEVVGLRRRAGGKAGGRKMKEKEVDETPERRRVSSKITEKIADYY